MKGICEKKKEKLLLNLKLKMLIVSSKRSGTKKEFLSHHFELTFYLSYLASEIGQEKDHINENK